MSIRPRIRRGNNLGKGKGGRRISQLVYPGEGFDLFGWE